MFQLVAAYKNFSYIKYFAFFFLLSRVWKFSTLADIVYALDDFDARLPLNQNAWKMFFFSSFFTLFFFHHSFEIISNLRPEVWITAINFGQFLIFSRNYVIVNYSNDFDFIHWQFFFNSNCTGFTIFFFLCFFKLHGVLRCLCVFAWFKNQFNAIPISIEIRIFYHNWNKVYMMNHNTKIIFQANFILMQPKWIDAISACNLCVLFGTRRSLKLIMNNWGGPEIKKTAKKATKLYISGFFEWNLGSLL